VADSVTLTVAVIKEGWFVVRPIVLLLVNNSARLCHRIMRR